MKPKRLAIFDLDGTLLDTIGDLAESCNYALRQVALPEHSLDEYRFFVGNGITRLVERALPESWRTPERTALVRGYFLEYYMAHIDIRTVPYDGIAAMLSRLQAAGLRFAVASNKFQAGTSRLVERFFPSVAFDSVHGSRDDVPFKPAPDIISDILRETGVEPSEAVMIGDSAVDMATARNAGIDSIGVTWGFRPRSELVEACAGRLADTPADVAAYILSCH